MRGDLFRVKATRAATGREQQGARFAVAGSGRREALCEPATQRHQRPRTMHAPTARYARFRRIDGKAPSPAPGQTLCALPKADLQPVLSGSSPVRNLHLSGHNPGTTRFRTYALTRTSLPEFLYMTHAVPWDSIATVSLMRRESPGREGINAESAWAYAERNPVASPEKPVHDPCFAAVKVGGGQCSS